MDIAVSFVFFNIYVYCSTEISEKKVESEAERISQATQLSFIQLSLSSSQQRNLYKWKNFITIM